MDSRFPDPAECYYVYGQPPPASGGHSGYWADHRVWDVINDVAAGLLSGPAAPCTGPGAGTGDVRRVSPGQVRELLRAAPPGPATLTQLTAEPDSAGHAVEVPAAEGAGPVDGDDGEIGR